jgi:hypothetical protein
MQIIFILSIPCHIYLTHQCATRGDKVLSLDAPAPLMLVMSRRDGRSARFDTVLILISVPVYFAKKMTCDISLHFFKCIE